MNCPGRGCTNTKIFKLQAHIPYEVLLTAGDDPYPLPSLSPLASWKDSPLDIYMECGMCGHKNTLAAFGYQAPPLNNDTLGPALLELARKGSCIEQALEKGWIPELHKDTAAIRAIHYQPLKKNGLIQVLIHNELGSSPSERLCVTLTIPEYEKDAKAFLANQEIASSEPTSCVCCGQESAYNTYTQVDRHILRCPSCYGLSGTCTREEAEKIVNPIMHYPTIDGPRTCPAVAFAFRISDAVLDENWYRGWFDPVTKKQVLSSDVKR